ncbi:phosphoribosylaminoimidazole synthetase [Alkalispirochaeta sphaeroplastigenens]|uniref:Phosphoribosylformylglycinamidine cyclo-ligase n=1 Tax=Alkalispirochaeta sphaeroplastigenens TaxID=1187066 RepID=A0A2S4JR60_9SPIO|nr:phosphoribosylformylglycinamidine cyclo-ligase [Alkalispirochaeta sphaeroplastigenens]POR02001.1 phosphoribosylaminoimidazole synthetase [Alkalispirochaeta sphaeroplastigenens]
MSLSYKDSGVDIEAGNRTVDLIRDAAASTFTPAVLTGVGSFGAFYDLSEIVPSFRNPVLVQSVDGVGTKTVVARQADDFSRIGADLVSACCNDIAVHGARPLTFLDYVANDVLDPERVAQIVCGIAEACRSVGASLIGGETAEMPGVYLPGEHDLVGVVTGIVERDRIINGATIAPGDVILGVASSGLHTNGFSLARKIIEVAGLSLEAPLEQLLPGAGSSASLQEALLEAHVNYTPGILALLDGGIPLRGMAHITGGGLVENIPRVLPPGCDALLDGTAWEVPPVFSVLAHHGGVAPGELHRVFNMGVGLAVILPASARDEALALMKDVFPVESREIGRVARGTGRVNISGIA